jgi:hypothetical protein
MITSPDPIYSEAQTMDGPMRRIMPSPVAGGLIFGEE